MPREPRIDPDALVARSATIVGDVSIAAGACIDHGVVIASSGPPVRIGAGAVVLANSVVRSVAGDEQRGLHRRAVEALRREIADSGGFGGRAGG